MSVGVTGKYTSVRHELAKQSGKHTAGEAAAMLSKILSKNDGERKIKVSAKEIVAAYKLLYGREPEWHHAGFYKPKGGKSTMGRTFFFTDNDVENLAKDWGKVTEKEKEIADERKVMAERKVTGFYYNWDYDYSGNYGKKRNYKVLHSYEGSELGKPKNFTPCSQEELQTVKLFEGKKYYGWDEPTIGEFSKEKYEAELSYRKKREDDKIEQEKKNQEYLKKAKEEQEKANEILDKMKPELEAKGVNLSESSAAWYIYKNFIEGTPNQVHMSKDKIKNWLTSNK